MKQKNHEYVRIWSSHDSVLVTECNGVMEVQHHSRICLLLVAVASGEFVHIDLNCKKASSLGISDIHSVKLI